MTNQTPEHRWVDGDEPVVPDPHEELPDHLDRPLEGMVRMNPDTLLAAIDETGIVEPERKVEIFSRLSAYVKSIVKEEGEYVRNNEVLATLDDSESMFFETFSTFAIICVTDPEVSCTFAERASAFFPTLWIEAAISSIVDEVWSTEVWSGEKEIAGEYFQNVGQPIGTGGQEI